MTEKLLVPLLDKLSIIQEKMFVAVCERRTIGARDKPVKDVHANHYPSKRLTPIGIELTGYLYLPPEAPVATLAHKWHSHNTPPLNEMKDGHHGLDQHLL